MGSGKTHLLNELKEKFDNQYHDLCFAEEPYDALTTSGILNSDFTDTGNVAILQAFFMKLYTDQLHKLLRSGCKVLFVDRTIHACFYVYLTGNTQPMHALYKHYLQQHPDLYSVYHNILFVNTDVNIAWQRIQTRARSANEKAIPIEYIQHQHNKLTSMFNVLDANVHNSQIVDLMHVVCKFLQEHATKKIYE